MSTHTKLSRILPVAALACGAWICSSAFAGAPALDVVVYSGLDNSPPGFPGLYWNLSSGFSNPVIDDQGKIAFIGTIFGDGITLANNRVMWHGDEDGWTVAARNGTPAFGLEPLILSTFAASGFPALSATGNLSLSATVAGDGVTTANDTAFWYGPIGAPGSPIARENTTIAPGTGGAVFSSAFGSMGIANSYRANNAGQVFFGSNLTGGDVSGATNNFGVYIGSSSGITEVWRKGNPIPGAPALPATDGPFMTPDTFGFFMNGDGEVAHTGTLVAGTAGGVTTANDKVLYTTVGGPMRIVAREGEAAPGGGNYGTSFTLATMGITNAGKILFNGGPAWYLDDHGTASRVIANGDLIDGEAVAGIQTMFLTNNDVMVMVGSATGNLGRIWTGPLGGPYTRVIEQGVTEVPGSPGVFLNFSAGSANAAVNNAGQIVFNCTLTGAGVEPDINDRAVFAWDPTEGLVMVARTGVTTMPELLDLQQLVLIGATGVTGDNGSAIFTDNGWLVLRFQDVKGFQAIVRTQPFVEAEPCVANVVNKGPSAGTVDIDDLLAVIGAWGACGDPNNCPADISPAGGDDVVDINDLLAVIGAWGPCP